MFGTSEGRRTGESNVRRRILAPAVELASERLTEAGGAPLPNLTPHALRRAFASLLLGIGRDPAYVMAQLGHADPGLTLTVYARVMRSDEGDRAALRALVGAADWAPMGTGSAWDTLAERHEERARNAESPV